RAARSTRWDSPRQQQHRNSEQNSASYSKLGGRPTTSSQHWKIARWQAGGPAARAAQHRWVKSGQQCLQSGGQPVLSDKLGVRSAVAPRQQQHRISISNSISTAQRQHSTASATATAQRTSTATAPHQRQHSDSNSKLNPECVFQHCFHYQQLSTAFTTSIQHSIHYL